MKHKKLNFLRAQDTIDVTFICNLQDEDNMDENFTIISIEDLVTPKELDLFYSFTKGFLWTLNEMAFFAICNELCLQIRDEAGTLLTSYGTCGIVPPIGDFNNDFNDDYSI